jgi:uncharacterized protein (TIGR02145 family)
MILNKAILTGLVSVSLCMAEISGIVTDTGTTPIAGAVVQLENDRQPVTTGADGRFTLVISAAVLHGKSTSLANGLSAGIIGNLMTVTVTERTIVEVATFDLNGKALSTVRQTMDAGTHSIALSQRGAGIYLYKVKSGKNEFVIKGNSVGGVSSGSGGTAQDPSSNSLAKQAKSMATINDVISVTKTGYLNYRCVQYNSDTSGIEIKMIVCAGTVTDIDGNVYQTVRIGNQVWMAENLRVTKHNDGSAISLVTDSAAWEGIEYSNLPTPAYCYYNNTTNADSIKKYGALYNWYVVSPANTKKLAPAGWHVPSDSEWTILENYLMLKVAKSLAAKTDWVTYTTAGTIGCDLTMNNSSGFSALPGGSRFDIGSFNYQSRYGYWWSATAFNANATVAWSRYFGFDSVRPIRFFLGSQEGDGFSVRLLRDN